MPPNRRAQKCNSCHRQELVRYGSDFCARFFFWEYSGEAILFVHLDNYISAVGSNCFPYCQVRAPGLHISDVDSDKSYTNLFLLAAENRGIWKADIIKHLCQQSTLVVERYRQKLKAYALLASRGVFGQGRSSQVICCEDGSAAYPSTSKIKLQRR